MCLCRKASVQAKMLGNRRRADEKRFENFGTGILYAEFSFLIFFDTKHQLRISNTFRETRCRRNKSSLLGRLRRTVILALLAFYSCTVCAHALLLSVTCV